MELISEQIIYLDFSLCLDLDEWDCIEISLPFIPRIGETITIDEFLNDEQRFKQKQFLKRHSNMSKDFVIKKINHLFRDNIQYTTLYLDFHETLKHIPFMFSYQ